MYIHEMKLGAKARVKSLAATDTIYRKRLIAMGLLPGTEIMLTRIAPLGDPIEILVRGFSLSLRKAEAAIIDVEEM